MADIIELSLKNLSKSDLEYRRASGLKGINSNKAVILLTQSKPELGILNTTLKANKCIDVLATISGS